MAAPNDEWNSRQSVLRRIFYRPLNAVKYEEQLFYAVSACIAASRRSYPSLENIVDSRRLVSEQEFYHGSNWTGSISPLATKNPYYHRSLTTRLDNRVLRLITPNSFRENRKLRVSRDYLSFLLSYILILGSLRWKSVCEFDESAAFALNNFVLTVTFDCLRLYDKIILLDNNNKIIIIDNNN